MTVSPPTPTRPATPAVAAPTIDWTRFEPFPSLFVGVAPFDASDSDQVRRYIDWESIVRKWELPGGFPEVLEDAQWGEPARQLLADANDLLSHWLSAGLLRTEVIYGVWQARAAGNQVRVQPRSGPSIAISFPRLPVAEGVSYCLADFIKPAAALSTGATDFIGGFAVRLHGPIDDLIQSWLSSGDEYRALLAKDSWLVYRSAVADYLHHRLRRFIWAYCDDDDLSNEEVLAGLHQGIRVDNGSIACPDPSAEVTLLRLLGADAWLSEHASANEDTVPPVLSGYFLAHPRSRTLREFTNNVTSPL